MSKEENEKVFRQVLEMSSCSNVIINTAGELDNIFTNYPYVNDYLNRIVIIANCGKKVLLYGEKMRFWEEYENSLFGPSELVLAGIEKILTEKGCTVTKRTVIDKLYQNFKVKNVPKDTVSYINDLLVNTSYIVCNNEYNLKLISEEINKGNTMRFICKNILESDYCVGVGNGILDYTFLELCDMAFLVNEEGEKDNIQFEKVTVRSLSDMLRLLTRIENAVKERASINSYSKMAESVK